MQQQKILLSIKQSWDLLKYKTIMASHFVLRKVKKKFSLLKILLQNVASDLRNKWISTHSNIWNNSSLHWKIINSVKNNLVLLKTVLFICFLIPKFYYKTWAWTAFKCGTNLKLLVPRFGPAKFPSICPAKLITTYLNY